MFDSMILCAGTSMGCKRVRRQGWAQCLGCVPLNIIVCKVRGITLEGSAYLRSSGKQMLTHRGTTLCSCGQARSSWVDIPLQSFQVPRWLHEGCTWSPESVCDPSRRRWNLQDPFEGNCRDSMDAAPPSVSADMLWALHIHNTVFLISLFALKNWGYTVFSQTIFKMHRWPQNLLQQRLLSLRH